jgi:serine/threonine protein kinase
MLDRLGAGGLGEVFRARDAERGRTVALRVVPREIIADPERRRRLLADIESARRVSHPSVSLVYEVAETDDDTCLVTEFVPGQTLRVMAAGHHLKVRRAIDVAVQIADGLADAHASGVVHGDLHPDNVIVTPKDRAKILELGLSRWTRSGDARRQIARPTAGASLPSTTVRTVAYMAPEQVLGEQLDERADTFSLGAMLYELLTGRVPFGSDRIDRPADLALQIVQAEPVRPSALQPGLPPDLDAVVHRALAKSVTRRYDSAATMAAELRAIASKLDERLDSAPPPQPERTSARSWKWWAIGGVLFAGLWALAWLTR